MPDQDTYSIILTRFTRELTLPDEIQNLLKKKKKLTCFSKAVGTSLLSSDKLLFIRSRRLFSIIYSQKKQNTLSLQKWRAKSQHTCKLSDAKRIKWNIPLFFSFWPWSEMLLLGNLIEWQNYYFAWETIKVRQVLHNLTPLFEDTLGHHMMYA